MDTTTKNPHHRWAIALDLCMYAPLGHPKAIDALRTVQPNLSRKRAKAILNASATALPVIAYGTSRDEARYVATHFTEMVLGLVFTVCDLHERPVLLPEAVS